MKFDRTRNSKEMSELLDYIVCLAIGSAIAAVLGISWVAAFVVVVWAFKSWKKDRGVSNSRIRILAIMASLLVLVLDNWSAYSSGVSDGFDAAAKIANKTANQSSQPSRASGPRG